VNINEMIKAELSGNTLIVENNTGSKTTGEAMVLPQGN
jgi:hypothetical protein